ncbi:MAG: PAS domain S-box protein [Bacteroidales bacterium]
MHEDDARRYQALLDNQLIPITIFNPQGFLVAANTLSCKNMNLPSPVPAGIHLRSLIPPNAFEQAWEKFSEVVSTGNPLQMEIEFNYQGNSRWFTIGLQPVFHENQLKEVMVLTINISEKAETLLKLHESEKLFETLFQESSIGLVYGSPTGEMIRVNQKFCDILGYSMEEIRHRNFSEFTHPEDLAWEYKYIEEMTKGGKDGNTYEKRYIRKNGEIVRVRLFNRVVRDPSGTILYGIIAAQDIQQEHLMKVALQENEEKFRTLFTASPDPVFIADRLTGEILEVNDRVRSIYGYTREEALKLKISDLTTEPDAAFAAMRQNIPLIPLRFHKKKNGEIFPVEITNAGSIIGEREIIIGTIRDISTRLKNEDDLRNARKKAEESDRLKSAFLANMSHEIRTPMNGIVGFANLLLKNDLSEKNRQEYAGIIIRSSEQLLNLVNDLLDISRIETGQIQFRKAAVHLNNLLDELYEFFLPKAREKKLNLNAVKALPLQEDLMETDETRIRQVMINLIGNALKFTLSGYINFGYRIKPGLIEFYVEDSGIGIPSKQLDMVFNRFWQGQADLPVNSGGAGLGLSISRGIVEKMGGSFLIDSTEGKGSVFSFTFPYVPVTDPHTAIHLMKEVKEQKTNFYGATVLIAEDEEFNYIFLFELLKRTGLTILHAKNGSEVLPRLEEHPEIKLILMDIKMPLMNGLDATRLVKKNYPQLPVIAQTAYAHTNEREQIMAAGCDDYISKPINSNELLRILSRYMPS